MRYPEQRPQRAIVKGSRTREGKKTRDSLFSLSFVSPPPFLIFYFYFFYYTLCFFLLFRMCCVYFSPVELGWLVDQLSMGFLLQQASEK